MYLIVIDGCERAGKSTIASILAEKYGATVVHWGPVPSDDVYAAALARQFMTYGPTELVVWDRSWASESVYSQLLNRGRRLGDDPWLGEWLYGRAVQASGTRCILLGPSAEAIAKWRDATDLPVDPAAERRAFAEYGKRFGWLVLENNHTAIAAETIAAELFHSAKAKSGFVDAIPPHYAGGPSPVVFLGESRSANPGVPGAWLPFTSKYTIQLARSLGDNALKCGWTNALESVPQINALNAAKLVVACGTVAARWATANLRDPSRVTAIPHPSWLYRWGKANGKIQQTELLVNELVRRALTQP